MKVISDKGNVYYVQWESYTSFSVCPVIYKQGIIFKKKLYEVTWYDSTLGNWYSRSFDHASSMSHSDTYAHFKRAIEQFEKRCDPRSLTCPEAWTL